MQHAAKNVCQTLGYDNDDKTVYDSLCLSFVAYFCRQIAEWMLETSLINNVISYTIAKAY